MSNISLLSVSHYSKLFVLDCVFLWKLNNIKCMTVSGLLISSFTFLVYFFLSPSHGESVNFVPPSGSASGSPSTKTNKQTHSMYTLVQFVQFCCVPCHNCTVFVVFTVVFYLCICILRHSRTTGNRILSPHVLRVGTVSGIDFSSLLLLIECT